MTTRYLKIADAKGACALALLAGVNVGAIVTMVVLGRDSTWPLERYILLGVFGIIMPLLMMRAVLSFTRYVADDDKSAL
jgi:hypothetical protein